MPAVVESLLPQTRKVQARFGSKGMSRRTFVRITALTIIVAATLVGGIYGSRAFTQQADGGAQRVESAYNEALAVIPDNYVEPVDYGKANEAAIQGMLWPLHPHPNYFNPEESRRI